MASEHGGTSPAAQGAAEIAPDYGPAHIFCHPRASTSSFRPFSSTSAGWSLKFSFANRPRTSCAVNSVEKR